MRRAQQGKVIIWSTKPDVVRTWHVFCGACRYPQCCNASDRILYTGQEARARMAQHWAEVHTNA